MYGFGKPQKFSNLSLQVNYSVFRDVEGVGVRKSVGKRQDLQINYPLWTSGHKDVDTTPTLVNLTEGLTQGDEPP